jgi:predicted transcriptional regulator
MNNETDERVLLDASNPHVKESAKTVRDASATTSNKASLIQFRIDDEQSTKLQTLADERHTTPSILARQFLVERIESELLSNQDVANAWHQDRLAIIQKEAKATPEKFPEEPFFVLHVIPLSKGAIIRPGEAQEKAGTLYPSRYSEFTGSVNHLGFLSRTLPEIPRQAYLQVFRTGQIETVRPIWAFDGVIKGSWTDAEIVHAAFIACSALSSFRIPLPYLILITVCGINSLSFSDGEPIDQNQLLLPPVEISKWDQISKNNSIEPMAQTLHESLNVFWNAGGVAQSMSFDGDTWLPAHHPGM